MSRHAQFAQYVVFLDATWRSSLDADGVSYTLFPRIEVIENDGPTDAEVTFFSAGSSFERFVNGVTSSIPFTDLASMRDRIDDNWLLSITEPATGGTGATEYLYLVDFDFNPALTAPPAFASSDVTTLGEYDGTIDWALQGTSAAFPGSGASLWARVETTGFSQLTEEDLPLAATSWSPGLGIADGLDEVRLAILTVDEAVDPAALSLASITPLTTGGEGTVAPTVTFGTTDLTYEARLGENLTVIPEPTTAALFALAGVGLLARRRRRRGPSHTPITAKENTTMPRRPAPLLVMVGACGSASDAATCGVGGRCYPR